VTNALNVGKGWRNEMITNMINKLDDEKRRRTAQRSI